MLDAFGCSSKCFFTILGFLPLFSVQKAASDLEIGPPGCYNQDADSKACELQYATCSWIEVCSVDYACCILCKMQCARYRVQGAVCAFCKVHDAHCAIGNPHTFLGAPDLTVVWG